NYTAVDTPALTVHQAGALQSYANGLHSGFPLIPHTPMTYPAALFDPNDFTNVPALVAKLQNDSDPKTQPISRFIWNQFAATNRNALAAGGIQAAALFDLSTNEPSAALNGQITQKKQSILANGLNQILQTNTLFDAVRASGIVLPDAQRKLVDSEPKGEQLARANRTFLEDTYSANLIARSPYLKGILFRITDRGSSLLLAFGGFLLFLIGRITGSFALRVFTSHRMLALYSLANILMMILTINSWGWWSVAGLFLSFFFMSITYPTIFSLGIHGLGEKTKIASSFIVMSIVGGAIMPFLMGWLADNWGMRIGFVMPLMCFILIAAYAASWRKLEALDVKVEANS
ncbi:MAG: hypothetical protein KGR98_09445, partial [Verrucomicrobia bacterium]|nr:hypothetical protein [Verrucomicrobiota bacterium]